jgi:hypothetical protein
MIFMECTSLLNFESHRQYTIGLCKYRVRVGSGVDVQPLRRVLDVLERR